MEGAWAGAGDSPRGRAEPGPGVASPPMPPRPSAPVLRGSRRGPPRVRGWAMGGGRWGGGAGPPGRGTGSSYRGPVTPCPARRGGPPPPFGVAVPPWCRTHPARRRPAAVGAGRVVPSVCSRQDRHRVAGGRVAFSPLAVRCRAGWKAVVACPGVGAAVAGMGGDRTRSVRRPRVSPKCRPCAISCHPAAPCGAGAAARALRAGGQVCLGSLPRAQSPTHTAVRRFARRAAAASRWASPRP